MTGGRRSRCRASRLGLAGAGLAVAVGGFLLSACGGGEGERSTPASRSVVEGTGPAAVVEMTDDLTFQPREVEIRVGQAVTWRNASLLLHTVTGDPGESAIEGSASLPEGARPFSSKMLESGQSFSHTFEVAGRYDYFCIPHEGAKMRGTVIVRP